MVKETPILFSGEMVRAILDGSKTQTRRVVKPTKKISWELIKKSWSLPNDVSKYCPHGQPGQHLWVRENFRVCKADNGWQNPHVVGDFQEPYAVVEYQDGAHGTYDLIIDKGMKIDQLEQAQRGLKRFPRFIPSIYMPRWACRSLLEITAVRVERLQDISEADARAEGVEQFMRGITRYESECQDLFKGLWRKINGPDSWDANPWVWVIEFRRIV